MHIKHQSSSAAAAVAVFVPPFIHTDVRAMRARRNDDDDDDYDDDGDDNVTSAVLQCEHFRSVPFCCIVNASARKRNRTTCRLHENLSLDRCEAKFQATQLLERQSQFNSLVAP